MKNMLARLWKEEEGQDLTEYALLLVLVALAAIGSLTPLATAINNTFSTSRRNNLTPPNRRYRLGVNFGTEG